MTCWNHKLISLTRFFSLASLCQSLRTAVLSSSSLPETVFGERGLGTDTERWSLGFGLMVEAEAAEEALPVVGASGVGGGGGGVTVIVGSG